LALDLPPEIVSIDPGMGGETRNEGDRYSLPQLRMVAQLVLLALVVVGLSLTGLALVEWWVLS
jgi:hypothetical protein